MTKRLSTTNQYDGGDLLAQQDGNNTNAIVRSYIWGSDLRGSAQWTWSLGGLLMINGPTTAMHENGPLGELICSSCTISTTDPYRWQFLG